MRKGEVPWESMLQEKEMALRYGDSDLGRSLFRLFSAFRGSSVQRLRLERRMKGRRKGSVMAFFNHSGSIVFIASDFLSAKVV